MKAIIIDDERLARLELRKLLQEFPEIEVIDEAVNADEAISKIEATQPDLIFLDIQMPGKTGFDMLAELDKSPHVIFTTAHHEFALKAFEVNALDYLMKPVEPKRLADALHKLQQAEQKEMAATLASVHRGMLSDIRLFESVGNYAKVFFANNKPLILKSLNALEERLDEKIFFRANRKHIVNLRMIEKIEPYFNGGLLLDMKGGEKIEVSRRQTVKFKEMMSL